MKPSRAVLWIQLEYSVKHMRYIHHAYSFVADKGAQKPEKITQLDDWLNSGWRIVSACNSCRNNTDMIVLEKDLV